MPAAGGAGARGRGGAGGGASGSGSDSDASDDADGGLEDAIRLGASAPASGGGSGWDSDGYRPIASVVNDQARAFREEHRRALRSGGRAAAAEVEARARREAGLVERLRHNNTSYLVDPTQLALGPFLDK
jgi:hypothetical protein